MAKPRVIKDFEKLDEEIQEQIKLAYPNGFSQHLISFVNKDGKKVSALPFETEEKYYLVRMSIQEAERIIEEDEDYDDDGFLTGVARDEYSEKYGSDDSMDDDDDDGGDDGSISDLD